MLHVWPPDGAVALHRGHLSNRYQESRFPTRAQEEPREMVNLRVGLQEFSGCSHGVLWSLLDVGCDHIHSPQWQCSLAHTNE